MCALFYLCGRTWVHVMAACTFVFLKLINPPSLPAHTHTLLLLPYTLSLPCPWAAIPQMHVRDLCGLIVDELFGPKGFMPAVGTPLDGFETRIAPSAPFVMYGG